MNKLEIAKKAVGFVVGVGVTKIVQDVIANNINEPEKVANKVTVGLGAVVLGMMAKDASKVYVGNKIDEIAQDIRDFKQKLKEIPEQEALTSDADPT